MVERGVDGFGSWAALSLDGITQRMRWIPPGRFLMGAPETETERFHGEGPRHEVTLTAGFWLFDTPVTQALWSAVMGTSPSYFPGPERPVEQVSWIEVQDFLRRLTVLVPDFQFALPTEAQWEYACRAGTLTQNYLGGAEHLPDLAWFKANSEVSTQPVKGKCPNGWGLYDMLGNVFEWCADERRDYGSDPLTDPFGVDTGWPENEWPEPDWLGQTGPGKVARGGHWNNEPRWLRAAYRVSAAPERGGHGLGFRAAATDQFSLGIL